MGIFDTKTEVVNTQVPEIQPTASNSIALGDGTYTFKELYLHGGNITSPSSSHGFLHHSFLLRQHHSQSRVDTLLHLFPHLRLRTS